MERFPQMLYRQPGTEALHGGKFSTLIVGDEDELAAALKDGWFETTPEAVEAANQPPSDGPSRAELEEKAGELGIKFDGRWGDKRLAEAIAAALKG